MQLYTIGHSNYPIDGFLHLLQAHGVSLLADVRSTPYSRFNPQFNRNGLQKALSGQQIEYEYLGDSLGGRPKDPTCYLHHAIPKQSKDYLHEVNYAEVMKRPWFIQGIRQLLELADMKTTAIMCSEEDPARCHRHHLIARYILSTYPEEHIYHIRKDARIIDAMDLVSPTGESASDPPSFLKP